MEGETVKGSPSKLTSVAAAHVSSIHGLHLSIGWYLPLETFTLSYCTPLSGDAAWSSWTSGACTGPCGQKGTAVATRKCKGPSQCCPGQGTRIEGCTNAPCN